MFWLRYLYTCLKKQPLFATKLEETSLQCLENQSCHWCRLHHDISKANIAFVWACFLIIFVNSHIVYMKFVDGISLLKFKNCCSKKVWLVDAVIVTDHSPPLGWASKSPMNHPWPEKFQPTCLSPNRGVWNVMIARTKLQISNLLCSVRHVACTFAWRIRESVFWSIICSFPLQFNFLLFTF